MNREIYNAIKTRYGVKMARRYKRYAHNINWLSIMTNAFMAAVQSVARDVARSPR